MSEGEALRTKIFMGKVFLGAGAAILTICTGAIFLTGAVFLAGARAVFLTNGDGFFAGTGFLAGAVFLAGTGAVFLKSALI